MRFILLLILSLLSLVINAQYYPHHHFTEEDGLVDNAVQDLLIDNKGYLWIATNNGISKYDGQSFKNIYKSDGLLNNRVWALACDDENSIWAGCYQRGLNKIVNDSVVASFKMNLDKYDNTIRKLHYSNSCKVLLVGTDDGVFAFKDSVFTRFSLPCQNEGKNSVLAIQENGDKVYFTIHGRGNGGAYELSLDTTSLEKSELKRLTIDTRFALELLGDSLYTNLNNQLDSWSITSTNSDTLYKYTEKRFLPWDMCSNGIDKIWLSGWGGDLRNAKVKEYNVLKGDFTDIPYAITGESFATNLYDEKNNILWVGGNGLFALKEIAFQTVNLPETFDAIQVDSVLFTIDKSGISLYHNGNILKTIPTQRVANRINQLYNKNKEVIGVNDTVTWYRHFTEGIPIKLIRFIECDAKGWLLTNKGCVSLPDFKEYLPFESGRFNINDNGEVFWIRDYEPIRYYDNQQDLSKSTPLDGLAGRIRDVVKIVQKGDTLLFPSHFHGMFALIDQQAYELNSSNGFDDIITDMRISSDNEIWCTSQDGNLFHVGLNDSLYVISRFNKDQGIVGTKYNWLKFHKDHLYIGTNKGLNVIPIVDLQNGDFNNSLFFNRHNGYEFVNSINPQVDSYERLFVNTSDKLIYIDVNNANFPEIGMLSSVSKVNNELFEINDANLSYKQNKIEISFKTITYPTANNIRYTYQINAGGWQNGNQIKLESLEAGEYQIELKATDITTNKSTSSSISFAINKAFWQSQWFIISSFVLLIVVVYIISIIRVRKIRKQAVEKEQLGIRLNEISIRSLQGQLNPHFIFNALNSIQYFILSKNVKDALLYLGNLSGVIRQNLNNLGEEMIPLEDETKFIKEYLELEKLRFKEKLEYHINVRTHSSKLSIPPMLIQPILENAIKHGVMNSDHQGEIWVDISESNVLSIIIKDNGVGLTKAKRIALENRQQSNGKAIKITKERIQLLNRKFKTNEFTFNVEELIGDDKKPEGTMVTFTLKTIN